MESVLHEQAHEYLQQIVPALEKRVQQLEAAAAPAVESVKDHVEPALQSLKSELISAFQELELALRQKIAAALTPAASPSNPPAQTNPGSGAAGSGQISGGI